MLMSVDGKISTGDSDNMDVDQDFPKIPGVKEGLSQYYELEKTTDLYSLNTGRVFAKIGLNEKKAFQNASLPVFFVIIDSKPHLTKEGIEYLLTKCEGVFILTTNSQHPSKNISSEKLNIFEYAEKIDFADAFRKLKDLGCDRLTIQSGGTLNSELVREGLIDHLRLVVAPAIIGGKGTSSLVDGESLHSVSELSKIRALKFIGCDVLNDSYIQLKYDVIN